MGYVADLYKKISVNYEIRSDLPRIFVGFRQKLRRSLQAVNDGAIFYESTEKTGQSAVCIQKNYIRPPYNTSLPYKNDFACTNVHIKSNFLRQTTLFNLFSGG